ncbi:hypothetical protein AB0M47_22330 [Hamadaea sp. NPDC051192]
MITFSVHLGPFSVHGGESCWSVDLALAVLRTVLGLVSFAAGFG